jgi:lysophospholipid acyltransferase (LPLAT)-like uncharacterized protein
VTDAVMAQTNFEILGIMHIRGSSKNDKERNKRERKERDKYVCVVVMV